MTPLPQDVVPALVDWYRQHARDLPWRREPTPYRILLSELMCQQTRIQTAVPYFERFVARWPTLEAFASASEDEVVEAWAGLGYYRRARSLHGAARAAQQLGGLPATATALRELPGIGPYTAGAIASIAFGEAAAAVDGNVERVLSRWDCAPEKPWSAAGKRHLQGRATALHLGRRADDHAGELTQALMELGARVCTPKNPTCSGCPVAAHCGARSAGEEGAWPRTRPRKRPTPIAAMVALTEHDGRWLLARRPPTGLLAGLWEPVMVPVPLETTEPRALQDGVSRRVGLDVQVGPLLGTVTHIFSHRRLTATVHYASGDGQAPTVDPEAYVDARWVEPGREPALSTLARKLLALRDAPPLLLAADHGRPAHS